MPAKLPPTSAFTYCAELSVDGAKSVRFDKSVVVYVDNFLGFNVGEIVPVGYYDRDRAVWVPADNGVVVRLLDTNGDGEVDAYTDGQNQYATYGLTDSIVYIPGTTFWRVEISHFSPWDCNWPFDFPEDAIPPNPPSDPIISTQCPNDDCTRVNSYIESRSRIFHEEIPIPGTDLTLHYASNRVKGYKSIITIPASGSSTSASLKNIIVRQEVAGQLFETTLSPGSSQTVEYIWDGLDYLGRQVLGSANVKISIGFIYQGVYSSARRDVPQAFAQAGTYLTGIRAREEVISWKQNRLTIPQGGIETIAGGWTLSSHHYINPSDPNTLNKGDGTTRKNNTGIITTIAGNGQWSYSGDGGSATQASLYYPTGMTADNAGNIYIADSYNNRVRKIDTNGIITTVAGNGQMGYSGDGGQAIQASLNFPHGVVVDTAGNIYIIDSETFWWRGWPRGPCS